MGNRVIVVQARKDYPCIEANVGSKDKVLNFIEENKDRYTTNLFSLPGASFPNPLLTTSTQ